MKKIYSLVLFLVVAATSVFAAPITSAGSGNWNSTTPNAPWPGGIVPSAGDDVTIRPGDNITVTANATIGSIVFSNGATRTFTVSSGVVLTVTNGITLQNGATGNSLALLAGAGTINCGSLNVGGTVVAPNLSADATTTLTSTISNLSISGDLSMRGVDDGADDNNAVFNLQSGNVMVGGTASLNEDNGSTVTLTLASGAQTGTLSLSGATPFTITGNPLFTANGNGATVIYSGAAQAVRSVTYNNLTLSGSGTKDIVGLGAVDGNMVMSGTVDATTGLNLTIGGTLDIASGSALTVAGFNFTVGNTTTIDGTLNSNSINNNKTFASIVINSGGSFNSSVNENYTINGGLQVNGTGNITSGTGTWNFRGNGTPSLSGTGSATITTATFSTSYINNGTFSFSNVDIGGAGTVTLTNNKTITISSTLTGTDNFAQGADALLNFGGFSIGISGFTAAGSNNTVNYTAAAQTIRGASYENLTLSGSNTKTLGANTTANGTLSMQGTAALALGGFTLNYGASSTLEYAGSVAQTTTSTEFKTPGGPTNLKINNGNGVTLHATRTIPGNVTFANGILTTAASKLLVIAGSVSGASDASFVDGPVKKLGAVGATNFDFPIGKTGVGYMKIGVANVTGATTEFTAQYVRASAMTTFGTAGLASLGIQGVSNCEYWTLDRTVTTSNADVTLYWNSHSPCGGSYLSDPLFGIRIAHYNTSLTAWDAQGGGSPSGDASSGSVTWSGVTNFSPFALAALIGSQSSLPVLFNDVRAFEKNNGVEIDWSNLTEKDIVNYVVEHSVNGVNYTAIAQQFPRSNNMDKQSYTVFDAAPAGGANYYRIKALEMSGKTIYTKAVRVDLGKTAQSLNLYPNPVTGTQLSVSINNKQGQYTLKIVNTGGQEVYSRKIIHQGGSMTQTIELSSSVKPGVYNLMISGDNYHESKMFIVQ